MEYEVEWLGNPQESAVGTRQVVARGQIGRKRSPLTRPLLKSWLQEAASCEPLEVDSFFMKEIESKATQSHHIGVEKQARLLCSQVRLPRMRPWGIQSSCHLWSRQAEIGYQCTQSPVTRPLPESWSPEPAAC